MWRFSLLFGMTLALSSSVLADDMLYDVAQPVELGVGRTLVVLQASTPSDQGLASWMGRGPLVLALSGIWAAEAPAVAYHLYLDLPQDSIPGIDDPGYLGGLNFYDTPDHYVAENPKRLSFLLDQALVRLREAGRLTQPPTLTFIPVRPEEPGYSPRVEHVSIVRTSD
ncbi:hypothetical protein [Pseudomonas sp. MWU13-2100]|uniref:hypothetical protein n=1 Tax=Pseudomonas sp. MWU13-2100 TaxID=2935075 RepID=UPI00200CD204|nr:hypothetical protein [Pseudomonas sp. MWU13-2100]